VNCEKAKEWMSESWSGELASDRRAQLELHLRSCPACAEESESLRELWNAMGELPVEKPGPEVRSRFYLMLDAYRLGEQQAARRRGSILATLIAWRPPRPVLQFAVAASLLIAGIMAGRWTFEREHGQRQVAQLSQEVQHMRQLVTLSLLQQQSATDRLRGVNWAVRLDQNDAEVLDALFQTLNQDSNVNVRLSAVDALQRFANTAQVRGELREALPQQTSPLVQIALIDSLAEARDRESRGVLEQLRQRPDVDPSVKTRIERALGRLQ